MPRFGSVLLHEFRVEVIPANPVFLPGFQPGSVHQTAFFCRRYLFFEYAGFLIATTGAPDRRQGGAHRRQDALPAPL